MFELSDHVTSPSYEAIRDALIAGYRTQRAISDEDLALLPQFLVIRALASLGWLHDRPEVELHEYMPDLIELSCRSVEELIGDS